MSQKNKDNSSNASEREDWKKKEAMYYWQKSDQNNDFAWNQSEKRYEVSDWNRSFEKNALHQEE